MKQFRIFEKRSRINAPVEEVFQWHEHPGAIQRLSPPWDPLAIIYQEGGIQTGAKVAMKMKVGPIPFLWSAQHIYYEKNRCFRDMQIKGPFSNWTHTHLFESAGTDTSILEDKIEYALPLHPISTKIFDSFIRRKLDRIFTYRHRTTIADISRHREKRLKQRFSILMSGASGLIGSSLVPFLTTGGHQVFRLVRKPPETPNELFWDPLSNRLDLKDGERFDAIIHLAGENIGEGWWTKEKKRRIIESRVKGTSTIANAVSQLKYPPKMFLCASAIGYYGNRGDAILSESNLPGEDFISDVCKQWEAAALPAVQRGIKVIFLRIGIVLTPAGGALAKLLVPFQLGAGGKISSGRQFMSWIDIDDVIYAIHHILTNEGIEGPVNIVSPNPCTNADFSEMLGKVLSKPVFLKVPSKSIEILFGEMGRETILSSTRVSSSRLENSGYQFSYPDLESTLRHVLGRYR